MLKAKTTFVCQGCGYQSPKWLGRCPECNPWNSLVEEVIEPSPISDQRFPSQREREKPTRISELIPGKEDRFTTGIGEMDRVLGGGVVAGSVVLVGGDPGIGKSTLLLQVLEQLGQRGKLALYASGEESPHQIKMRGDRLGTHSDQIYLLSATSLEEVLTAVREIKPAILVVDSIQTLFTVQLQSAPGSVSQVREVATRLMFTAKETNTAVFIIGHVTKEGAIAGPRVLEHIVDTVLYFEGERGYTYRILRAVKNRFGSTNEIGVFEMKETGLAEVGNPSNLFLAERPQKTTGSVVIATMEGTRPILVELQALVCATTSGLVRRTSIGVDHHRVSLLLAVLEKRLGIPLQQNDVYVNVAGGIRIEEPAIDLGIVAAVLSSLKEHPIESTVLLFGEVGLGGEVRAVTHSEQRIREAQKMGFTRCLLPDRNHQQLKGAGAMEFCGVQDIAEAFEVLFT